MAAVPDIEPSVSELLQRAGVGLDSGLTVQEVDAVEHRFGFRFLPEHRAFLRLHLPTGSGWPDWRAGEPSDLEDLLAWPVSSTLFDVRNNGFWPLAWGERPLDESDAVAVARRHVDAVPKLVPVYRHRYLPAEPAPRAAPVFSVYQTDVIYYGNDLADYIDHEFGMSKPWTPRPTIRIPFWSDLAEDAEKEDL
jgi:hypothetical protein